MHARSIKGILSGAKTQTRRIVAPSRSTVLGRNASAKRDAHDFFDGWKGLDFSKAWVDGKSDGVCGEYLHVPLTEDSRSYRVRSRIEPGDHIWIKEAWLPRNSGTLYRADYGPVDAAGIVGMYSGTGKWKPSMFMPRWASRLTLQIASVRVERVQDISENDARSEGVEITDELTGAAEDLDGSHAKAFKILWDDTNGKGAWDRNDWVWVLEFKRESQ